MFETIQDLVQYYTSQSDGLCVNLVQPCLLSEKPQTAGLSRQANEEWEIDRRQIRLVRRLGAGQFGGVGGAVEQHHVSGSEDSQTRHHVPTGVPAGGCTHEETATPEIHPALRRLHKGGAHLHCDGTNETWKPYTRTNDTGTLGGNIRGYVPQVR